MPAQPKIQFEPEKVYHVLNRGNNRRIIFHSDQEYLHFLQLVKKYLHKVGYVHAYALMDNHFHLVIEIFSTDRLSTEFSDSPEKITRSLGHLQNAYAKWYNFRHKAVSSLFERSFERYLIIDETYYRSCVRYLHFNPLKHGVSFRLQDYKWTSYRALSGDTPNAFDLLATERVLDRFGGLAAFRQFHQSEVDALHSPAPRSVPGDSRDLYLR